MSREKVPAALNMLLPAMVLGTAFLVLGSALYAWGIDAMQLYGAAELVNRGEARRLYDEAYFQQRQVPLADGEDCSRHYYLYPPVVAMVLSP